MIYTVRPKTWAKFVIRNALTDMCGWVGFIFYFFHFFIQLMAYVTPIAIPKAPPAKKATAKTPNIER